MRACDRDLIRGGHYGQRSCEPHSKAEHMAAPTNAARVKKVLANTEPSTHGPKRRFVATQQSIAFGGEADTVRPNRSLVTHRGQRNEPGCSKVIGRAITGSFRRSILVAAKSDVRGRCGQSATGRAGKFVSRAAPRPTRSLAAERVGRMERAPLRCCRVRCIGDKTFNWDRPEIGGRWAKLASGSDVWLRTAARSATK